MRRRFLWRRMVRTWVFWLDLTSDFKIHQYPHWSIFIHNVSTGQVWSWGDGDYGKLGRGGSDGCKTPKLVEKLQDLDIVKVCCGSQFSVALTKDGQVYTWGKGDNQRLGHGTDEHVRYPKLLDSLQGEFTVTAHIYIVFRSFWNTKNYVWFCVCNQERKLWMLLWDLHTASPSPTMERCTVGAAMISYSTLIRSFLTRNSLKHCQGSTPNI